MKSIRTMLGLWKLVRRLENAPEEIRGATLELRAEPDWSLAQRAERARLSGHPAPERTFAWEVLYFRRGGEPASVGRGVSCWEAVKQALETPPKSL